MAYQKVGSNKGKPHYKTIDRCRIAVRLELLNIGLTANDIAAHLGMTASSYSLLKRTQVYKILKQQYFTGVLSHLDQDIIGNTEQLRKTLQAGVPIALENLVHFALRRDNARICMEATKEILNRDGHFAAVTRIGLPTSEQGGFTSKQDEETAGELLQALALVSKKKENNTDNNSNNISNTIQ